MKTWVDQPTEDWLVVKSRATSFHQMFCAAPEEMPTQTWVMPEAVGYKYCQCRCEKSERHVAGETILIAKIVQPRLNPFFTCRRGIDVQEQTLSSCRLEAIAAVFEDS